MSDKVIRGYLPAYMAAVFVGTYTLVPLAPLRFVLLPRLGRCAVRDERYVAASRRRLIVNNLVHPECNPRAPFSRPLSYITPRHSICPWILQSLYLLKFRWNSVSLSYSLEDDRTSDMGVDVRSSTKKSYPPRMVPMRIMLTNRERVLTMGQISRLQTHWWHFRRGSDWIVFWIHRYFQACVLLFVSTHLPYCSDVLSIESQKGKFSPRSFSVVGNHHVHSVYVSHTFVNKPLAYLLCPYT